MKCNVCDGQFRVDEIEEHLPECLKKAGAGGGPRCDEETFVVSAKWMGRRMIARVAASSNLEGLEDLIRSKWFDWDHLSAFVIDDRDYAWNEQDARTRGVPTMKETRFGDVMHGVTRFRYEYDFGSVKRVQLTARPVPAGAVAMEDEIDVVAERTVQKRGAGGKKKKKPARTARRRSRA